MVPLLNLPDRLCQTRISRSVIIVKDDLQQQGIPYYARTPDQKIRLSNDNA